MLCLALNRYNILKLDIIEAWQEWYDMADGNGVKEKFLFQSLVTSCTTCSYCCSVVEVRELLSEQATEISLVASLISSHLDHSIMFK